MGTGTFWRIAAVLLGAAAVTAEAADVSLKTEVDRYLAAGDAAGPDPNTFRVFWKDGIRMETSDKSFSIKLGGRIMVDAVWNESDDIPGYTDGVEFRRARLYFEGKVYERVAFKAQYDFAGSEIAFKDVWIGITKIADRFTLKVGHHKEPFSLQEQTSSKYIELMERSPAVSTFSPSRNTGVSIGGEFLEDDRLHVRIGVFRDTDDSGDGFAEGGYNVTARITGVPMENADRHSVLHVGLAVSLRDPNDETLRYRARASEHVGPRLVDTGTFDADSVLLTAFEVAFTWESFRVQGEFFLANTDAAAADDPSFSGWYVQASYWLTGERPEYSKSSGAFSRVKPNRNFGSGGSGAWQVVVRYSMVDLNDGAITGGELSDFAAGVNWHLNPNTRVMFNFVLGDVGDTTPEGDASMFLMRWQIDF